MNNLQRLIKLLEINADRFNFKPEDFEIYKNLSEKQLADKINEFVKIFVDYDNYIARKRLALENKVARINKKTEALISQNKNKEMAKLAKKYKASGFSRAQIAELMQIDLKKLASLEN